jgi:fibronectin-binding autotransporter adhesin
MNNRDSKCRFPSNGEIIEMKNFKARDQEPPAKARSREGRKDFNYSKFNTQHPTSRVPNLLPLRPVWNIVGPVLNLGKRVGLLAVMVLASGHLNAQVTLAGWDFSGKNSSVNNPLTANTTASNITIGGLTLGSGITTSSTADTFGGTNWTQGGGAATTATNNDFISLTLTANAGYTISLNGISAYNIRRSSTGPNSFLWQYQLGSSAWTDIGSTLTVSGTTSGGNTQSAITLNGISALQSVSSSSTIGLRLLGWGATGTSGTGFLNQFQSGDDFIITGSVASASAFTTWSGTGSAGTWSNGTAGQLGGNYANDLTNTVTFTGTGTNVTASGPVQAGSLIFNTDSYILGGAVQLGVGSITTTGSITTNITASISGNASSGVTKAGAGTLILSGSNSYTGTTTLNTGTITMGNANALGSTGNITFSGGSLQYGSGITQDISSRIRNSGSAIIVDTNNNNVSFGTALDASNTGGLTKQGTGTLTLSVSNTLTGPLQVTGGTLSLSSGTLTINTASASTISGTLSGSGSLTKQGSGTLTISNNNSGYSGETRLEGGVLEIGDNGALGAGTVTFRDAGTIRSTNAADRTLSLAIGTFTGSTGTVYTFGSAGTGNLTFSGTGSTALGSVTRNLNILNNLTTFGQSFTGTGAITKSGAGTLILAGANTYTGNTTINAGTLQLGNGGTSGSLSTSSNITVNGTLAFNRSNDVVQGTDFKSSVVISGTGSLVQMGTGNLTLNAANTYSGGTTLNSGTLVINNASAIGSGTFSINGGTLNNTSGSTITLSTNNAQSWNGDFAFTGTNDLNLGTGAVTLNATRTITVNSGNLTVGGTISGTGFGLTKNGTGTLILSGSNSYTGNTTINAGTLQASVTGALGNTTIINLNGGSLLVAATDAINDSTEIRMGGGKLALSGSGISETIGAMTLTANSVIDLYALSGVSTLKFGDSSSKVWTAGATLQIWNWDGTNQYGTSYGSGNRRIYFGSNGNGLTASQLSQISFYSDNGTSFIGSGFIDSTSMVGAVPEPETIVVAILILAGIVYRLVKQNQRPKED